MFDSIKDIFSSEPEEISEEVGFDEFGGWFEKRFEDSGSSWSDLTSKYRDIEKALETVERKLNNLKSGEIPEEIAPRLLKAGKSNKKALVRQLQRFLDRFQVPEEEDIKTAAEFARGKSEDLGELSDRIQRNFLFVEKVQESEARKLLNSVSRLEDEIKPDEELLKAEKIKDLYSDLAEFREEKQVKEKKVEKLKDKLEEAREGLEEARRDLRDAEESVPTHRIEELEKKIEELEKEGDRLRNGMIQAVSPLRRGLKKLSYSGAAPEGKERLLEKYIEKPSEAVREDRRLEYLEKLRGSLGKALKEESLDFSEEEKDKIREEVESLDIERLEKLKERWRSSSGKIEDLKSDLRNLRNGIDKGKFKSKLREREGEVERLSDRIDKKVGRIKDLDRKIRSYKKDIRKEVGRLLNIDLEFLE